MALLCHETPTPSGLLASPGAGQVLLCACTNHPAETCAPAAVHLSSETNKEPGQLQDHRRQQKAFKSEMLQRPHPGGGILWDS